MYYVQCTDGPVVKVHEPSVQGGSGKQIQLACQEI